MDPRLIAFQAFLRDVGATFDSNAIAFTNSKLHGFGVVARKPVKKGTVLATIPKSAILSVKTASLWKHVYESNTAQSNRAEDLDTASETDEAQFNRNRFCPPLFQLPAAVLFESLQAQRSPWFHYLSVLPRSLAEIGVPLAEKEEDVTTVCRGTGIEIVSGLMRSKLRTAFEKFVKPLFRERAKQLGIEPEVIDSVELNRFVLAFAWVTSRAFEVDALHGNSLVPIADMFNHETDGEHVHIEGSAENEDSDEGESNEEESEDEDQVHNAGDGQGGELSNDNEKVTANSENGEHRNAPTDDNLPNVLRIVCVRDVTAGKEVFNTFGQKSNTILYLNYGFTEAHNAHDTAFVHKSDVEEVLRDFSTAVADEDRRMTEKRQNCIETAREIVEVDVIDDFFQITTDGSFCHGLMLLIYLHVVPWKVLAPYCDDEFELMEHLMQLSVQDILDIGAKHIALIVKQIRDEQVRKFPPGTSLATDEAALNDASHDMAPLVKNTLQIRIGQRTALQLACSQLLSHVDGASELARKDNSDIMQSKEVESSRVKRRKVG